MKKALIIVLTLLSMTACSSVSGNTDLAQLYTGYEQGSWYHFSPRTCSADLCPAY